MGNREAADQRVDLSREEPYFQAVFNDPHVFMALLDPRGAIRQVNRAAADVVEPDESQMIGTPFWEGPWWSHSKQVRNDLRRRVERASTGEYVEFEFEYHTGNDEKRLTAGILRPVEDDGQVVSIVASGRDITDQVHQQQRLDVLRRLLRHNVRNSLNVVHGYAEEILDSLSDSSDNPERAELEAKAQTIADEAMALSDSVTKIKRLEQYNPGFGSRVTVETLFTRVSEEVRSNHPNCEVESTVPESDVEVSASFTVAVVEAVTNAVKHHPESTPTIELAATLLTDADPPHVRLRIADDGPGIPRSEFTPVIDGEETDLTHTSGVGLWLIKWVVEKHGGDLSIESNEPQGSSLTFTIPVPSASQ